MTDTITLSQKKTIQFAYEATGIYKVVQKVFPMLIQFSNLSIVNITVRISLFKVIIADIIFGVHLEIQFGTIIFALFLFEICPEAVGFLNENKLDHWFKPNLTIKN